MKKVIQFTLKNVPRKYLQRINLGIFKILGLWYRGDDVQCPICLHTYKKFLPYGRQSIRENALCANCLSLERHRLIWYYLKNETDFFNQKPKVLHVAPESCLMSKFIAEDTIDYTTADIESPLADVKMDIHDMPFEDNSFDVVLCNHVLEHVDDDKVALSEIYRVLKPTGWAILQVPFFNPVPDETLEDPAIKDPKEREKLFGQDDHVRKYGKDYADRLRSSGFNVTVIPMARQTDPELVRRYGLMKDEDIYIGTKPGGTANL